MRSWYDRGLANGYALPEDAHDVRTYRAIVLLLEGSPNRSSTNR